MKILYLGPMRTDVVDFIRSLGDEVVQTEENINERPDITSDIDQIVSFGYRHIIAKALVRRFANRIVNLHISYLPWNRGADPNVWSFLEDTPKGVSIHYIDSGVDTGPILVQQRVSYSESDTLRTSYDRLIQCMEELFRRNWPAIRAEALAARPQLGTGTNHRSSDLDSMRKYLTRGWDTPVIDIIGKGILLDRRPQHVR